MSADNWRQCPKCKSESPRWGDMSMREDYEVGMEGTEFYVLYSAACMTCDFRFEFKHKQEVKK